MYPNQEVMVPTPHGAYAIGKSGEKYRGRSKKNYEQSERALQKLPIANIPMPSGDVIPVTIPSRRCRCETISEPKYIRLFPDGYQMNGFEYRHVWQEMHNFIQNHHTNIGTGFSEYEIVKIHKIINCCLYTKFRNRMIDMEKEGVEVNQRLLFHGSVSLDKIVKSGFDERHSFPGGMYGAGIYFAVHSSKSNQYVYGQKRKGGCKLHNLKCCYECERQMLLCRVLLGKMSKQTKPNLLAHAPAGCHSVAGTPSPGFLLCPEYVVYRGDQAYPEYLITYKLIKKNVDKQVDKQVKCKI